MLTCLIIDIVTHVSADNTIRICHNFALGRPRPTFKYDHFIELLALRFMHVHNNHARFRLRAQGEMLLNEGLADNF